METWLLFGMSAFTLFSISSVLDKYLINHKFNAVITNSVKMIFDGIILLILALMFFPDQLTMKGVAWFSIVVLGFLYAIQGCMHFSSYKYDDISELAPFQNSIGVLFTFIAGIIILNEKTSTAHAASVALIILGTTLVISRGRLKIPSYNKGFLIALMITIVATFYSIGLKQVLATTTPVMAALLTYLFCLIFLGAYIRKNWKHYKNDFYAVMKIDRWPKIFLSAVFGAGGVFLYFTSLKLGAVSRVLPLSSLSVVLTMLIGWIFLKEKFYVSRLIGILLVIIGIYLLGLLNNI